MEFVIKTNNLRKALHGVATLVSEAKLIVNDGFEIRARDPGNIAMVMVTVPKEDFEKYDGGFIEVGVDVERMYDTIKSFAIQDLAKIKVNSANAEIVLQQKNLRYSVGLIDPAAIMKTPKVPDLDAHLRAKAILSGEIFKRMIAVTDKISDVVVFRTDDKGFYAEAEGDVERVTVGLSEVDLVDFNKQESRSRFSLEYLKEFAKVVSKDDFVELRIGKDYPLFMRIKNNDFKTTVDFILAPRIEEVD
jgi:proliferating cell nuclear antigen